MSQKLSVTTISQLIKLKYIIHHHRNGEMQSKTPYLNGSEHGVATWWYRSVSKYLETMWMWGEICAQLEWSETGRLIKGSVNPPAPVTKATQKIKIQTKNR